MRVHLGATILQQAAYILKRGPRRLRIVRRNSARGRKQVRSDSIRVGMKDKRCENIAEDHSTENEADAADHKDSSRAPRRKSLCGLSYRGSGTDCAFMTAHRSFRLATMVAGMSRASKRRRERPRNSTEMQES